MTANIKKALATIDTSYVDFYHNCKPLAKQQVKTLLEYGLNKGYSKVGQIENKEVESVLNQMYKDG